jgi:thymidylate kinase
MTDLPAGKLITVAGIDGAGKSTLAAALHGALKDAGHDVVLHRQAHHRSPRRRRAVARRREQAGQEGWETIDVTGLSPGSVLDQALAMLKTRLGIA